MNTKRGLEVNCYICCEYHKLPSSRCISYYQCENTSPKYCNMNNSFSRNDCWCCIFWEDISVKKSHYPYSKPDSHPLPQVLWTVLSTHPTCCQLSIIRDSLNHGHYGIAILPNEIYRMMAWHRNAFCTTVLLWEQSTSHRLNLPNGQ